MTKQPKQSIIFFGTHNFATTILEGLIKSPFISVELVITQPEKPVGRKQEKQKSPVQILAEKYDLKVVQPEKLTTFTNLIPKTHSLIPDLAVVAQYGLLIPEDIINTPKFGTLNVHTSLLPKYRGASPIQSAIINGETTTGVTIMKMDKGLDTGPILLQKEVKIEPDDTYPTLDTKMAKIGLEALLEAIPLYTSGQLEPKPQDNTKAIICKQLTRDNGKVDWTKNASEIYNLYRGLHPWPGIWTILNKKRLKLISIEPSDKKYTTGMIMVEHDNIFIGCKDASIKILELQLEGKKPMDAKTFLNGNRDIDASILE